MTHDQACGTGGNAPGRDEGPTVAAAAPLENKRDENPDCVGEPRAEQALRTIEGENAAARFLGRLRGDQAEPDELAVLVSMLCGAALRGFCRVLAKELGVRHG